MIQKVRPKFRILIINFKECIMKVITKSLIIGAVAVMASGGNLFAQCDGYTYYPQNMQMGWNSGVFYEVIDLDAATLTDETKYPRTGAEDGKSDNLNYSTNVEAAEPGSGAITLPLRNYDPDNKTYVPSGSNYDVKFVRCTFAPDHYGSAYTKIEDYGELPAGKDNACTINDNTCLIGKVYDKQGFIELARKAAPAGEPLSSLCGYIQLDNLYGIEKIQWSYSSTSWKRGVICEVRYGGEGEEWIPQRILPSDVNNYAIFSEQGYEFEESIDMTDEDTWDIPLSIRFRPFDCDTITFASEKDLDPSERSNEYYYKTSTPLQVVRIHQIKVWSMFSGSELAAKIAASGTGISDLRGTNDFAIRREGKLICASEECMIEVYTIDGKLIKHYNGTKMDISDLSKGAYVIKAMTSNGKVGNLKVAL